MNYVIFDDKTWDELLPLTFTRPVAEIRLGILTIREKWDRYLVGESISYCTRPHLREKFPMTLAADNIFVNGSVIPTAELMSEIDALQVGQALITDDIVCAIRLDKAQAERFDPLKISFKNYTQQISESQRITRLTDIFSMDGDAIENDFRIITKGRKSQHLSATNQVIGNGEIFIDHGAVVECCTLNTTNGSIYIGRNSEVMEGSVIRGPFSLGSNSVVKMGAKIYGPTTVGPNSKVGGELNNVVIIANSNKGHDGFLGNSVVGEWCNFGADTNCSNLKNDYAEVRQWNYPAGRFVPTGLQFCGLVMGDHSKTSINTMFNTGTVVGVAANIFGSGFPRNFVPSFSWGGAAGFTECSAEKACEIAERVMARRNIEMTDIDKRILAEVFKMTAKYRVSSKK